MNGKLLFCTVLFSQQSNDVQKTTSSMIAECHCVPLASNVAPALEALVIMSNNVARKPGTVKRSRVQMVWH